MKDENGNTDQLLDEVRSDLEREDRRSVSRAWVGVGLRIFFLLFVAGYMTWVHSAVSRLDADSLTKIAAMQLEERLPQMRADLRDYAIARAPEVIDKARDLLLELPAQLRKKVESQLLARSDELIARLESDVDIALGVVIDDQIEAIRTALPDGSPEDQLDALILGLSDTFRDTMIAAVDELYEQYSAEVTKLNDHLIHLQKDEDLSDSEIIDKKLLEAWMVLVQKHEFASPRRVKEALQAGF